MMSNKLIYLAAVLSAGVHLAVFVPLASNNHTLVIESPARPISSITLVARATSEQPQAKTEIAPDVTQVRSKPVAKSTTKTQMAKSVTTAKNMTPQETKHNAAAPPAQHANSADPRALIDHDMLEYLHAEFRLRFRYPLLARKRGWSGEVVIALNVNHKGMIHDIAVQKSSGYPLLDNNAIDTFRAIGLVSPAIQSRIDKTQHLSIPVIYKLTGG